MAAGFTVCLDGTVNRREAIAFFSVRRVQLVPFLDGEAEQVENRNVVGHPSVRPARQGGRKGSHRHRKIRGSTLSMDRALTAPRMSAG